MGETIVVLRGLRNNFGNRQLFKEFRRVCSEGAVSPARRLCGNVVTCLSKSCQMILMPKKSNGQSVTVTSVEHVELPLNYSTIYILPTH